MSRGTLTSSVRDGGRKFPQEFVDRFEEAAAARYSPWLSGMQLSGALRPRSLSGRGLHRVFRL